MTIKKLVLTPLVLLSAFHLLAQKSNEVHQSDKKATMIRADEIIAAGKKVMALRLQTLCLE
jgi:hypothetical protein